MKTLDRKPLSMRHDIFVLSSRRLDELALSWGKIKSLRDRAAIQRTLAVPAATFGAWVADDARAAATLLAEASKAALAKRQLGKLVFLEPPSLARLAPALDVFASVAWADARKAWLPLPELLAVLNADQPRAYIVGGMVDQDAGTLTVYRGDFTRLTVPLSLFAPSGAGTRPDPSDFAVIDSGHAIRLGEYEAATDAIFYEADADYRKRQRQKLRAEEKTFGASLRRLRVLRGLRQGDFAPLTAKTIARIERGEVARPHGKTLVRIAEKLAVHPQEIESY